MELPVPEGLKSSLRKHATMGDVVFGVVGLAMIVFSVSIVAYHAILAPGVAQALSLSTGASTKAAEVQQAVTAATTEIANLKADGAARAAEIGAVADEVHVVHRKIERMAGALDVRMPQDLRPASDFPEPHGRSDGGSRR